MTMRRERLAGRTRKRVIDPESYVWADVQRTAPHDKGPNRDLGRTNFGDSFKERATPEFSGHGRRARSGADSCEAKFARGRKLARGHGSRWRCALKAFEDGLTVVEKGSSAGEKREAGPKERFEAASPRTTRLPIGDEHVVAKGWRRIRNFRAALSVRTGCETRVMGNRV